MKSLKLLGAILIVSFLFGTGLSLINPTEAIAGNGPPRINCDYSCYNLDCGAPVTACVNQELGSIYKYYYEGPVCMGGLCDSEFYACGWCP